MTTVCSVCLKCEPTIMCQECKRICYCSEKCRINDNNRHKHDDNPTQADDSFVKERERQMGDEIMNRQEEILNATLLITEGLLYMNLSDNPGFYILSANFDKSVKEKVNKFKTAQNLTDLTAMAYRVVMTDIVFEGILYVSKNTLNFSVTSPKIIIHGEKYYIDEKVDEIQQEMENMILSKKKDE